MALFTDALLFCHAIKNALYIDNQKKDIGVVFKPNIICFDYGSYKTGIAIFDECCKIGFPKDIIHTQQQKKQSTSLAFYNICKEQNINKIVFGWPKTLNNNISKNCQTIFNIAKHINELFISNNIPVYILLFDERFTTKLANNAFNNVLCSDNTKKHKAKLIKTANNKEDARAACIILNDVLSIMNTI